MVLAAEPDYFIESQDLWQPPNDTGFNQQWTLGATPGIRAQQAWTMTNGITTPNRVRVGLFETGLDASHPDLRVIGGNMISGNANHGTHVGGIIGAITHNNKGVAGIAQVELALLDRGNGGSLNSTNQGVFPASLVWAIDNDIRIVNCSFRFILNGEIMRKPIAAHREAIRVFGENGGLLVAAAANDTEDLDVERQYPAAYGDSTVFPEIDNVITVGSIDSNGGLSSFSNWGANSVHIYAPGGNILSTMPTGKTPEGYMRHSDGYAYADGTSMAAPHVAGVAALMLSINPELTPQQIRINIINSGTDVKLTTPNTSFWPWQNNSITFNSRRLDAFMAVSSVANFTYEMVTEGIKITGAPRTLVGSFEIPRLINGQTVVAIGNSAFSNQRQISQISIPSSVEYIGDYAFSNCTSLSQVNITDKTTNFGITPFSGCTKLYGTILSIKTDYHRIIDDAGKLIWEAHDFIYDDNHSSTHHDLVCRTCGFKDKKSHNKKIVNGIEVCSTCPWVGDVHTNHEYTYSYFPIPHSGNFPINLHKASCFCGEYIEVRCLGRFAENGKAYCIYCGRDMTGALGQVINRIELPESKIYDHDIDGIDYRYLNECCITNYDHFFNQQKNVLYVDVNRRERSFYGGA